MSSWNRTRESANLTTFNSILAFFVSPLPHSPGYSGDCSASYPESDSVDYSAGYPARNPESYLDGNPASYRAGYLPQNPANCGKGCPDRNSANHSADCPGNRPVGNPASNSGSNGADHSDSYLVDSPPDCLASYAESLNPRPVNEPTQVQGTNQPAERLIVDLVD